MRVKCPDCGGDHPKWDCKRPAKKSTAERKAVHKDNAGGAPALSGVTKIAESERVKMRDTLQAGTQALPVDTNRESSPSPDCKSGASPKEGLAAASSNLGAPTKFDKKAWQREYMREYMRKRRAAAKI